MLSRYEEGQLERLLGLWKEVSPYVKRIRPLTALFKAIPANIKMEIYWRRCRRKILCITASSGITIYVPRDKDMMPLLSYGTHEPLTTKELCGLLSNGDVAVDVGAYVGWYAIHFSKAVGGTGKVFAFEPNPTVFPILIKNLEVNGCKNCRAFNLAVSNSNGALHLEVHPIRADRSRVVKAFEGGVVKVQSISLDEFLPQLTDKVDLIKVDVEGIEVNVLEGCKNIIKQQLPKLFIEFHPEVLRYGERFAKLLRLLDSTYTLQFFLPRRLNLPYTMRYGKGKGACSLRPIDIVKLLQYYDDACHAILIPK